MEFTQILKLARQLNSPKVFQINSNTSTFAIANQFEKKILSAYVYKKDAKELEYLKDFHMKKKILQLWQNGDTLCIIDKFGDLYQLPLSYLNDLVVNKELDSTKNEELDKQQNKAVKEVPFTLVTNLFSVIIAICPLPEKNLFVCSDDYYKIKILNATNLQYIHKIFSLRPAFVKKILAIDESVLFFFDDSKVLVAPIAEISRLDAIFDEDKLINFGEAMPEDCFYNDIITLSNGEICSLLYEPNTKIATLYFWNYNPKARSFVLINTKTIDSVNEEFFVFEDNRYLHTRDKDIDLLMDR